MKTLLLILCLACAVAAQTRADAESIPEWKFIPELSGDLLGYVNLSLFTGASKISRDGDRVKLWMKFEFPNGAPMKWFPRDDVGMVYGLAILNCKDSSAKLQNGAIFVYGLDKQFVREGKDREVVRDSGSSRSFGRALFNYFCERPTDTPKTKPKLKSRNP